MENGRLNERLCEVEQVSGTCQGLVQYPFGAVVDRSNLAVPCFWEANEVIIQSYLHIENKT